jgi:2,4-dienoyl-CoA reductase-like NADH-dependent reductase (Old Yellow Enzyme family)
MKTLSANKLFTRVRVGSMELEHRVAMAPLTRSRSVQPGSIPGDLMIEYFSQQASDGGLIVSEGTSISIAHLVKMGARLRLAPVPQTDNERLPPKRTLTDPKQSAPEGHIS